MLYIAILILLLLLCFHYDYQGHTELRKECYFFVLLIFIVVAGLRFNIGIDTVRYRDSFEEMPDLFEYWNFDFDSTRAGRGYLLLNAIVKTLFSSFTAMQFVLAIIVNVVIFKFFYKNTNHIFLALIFYFLAQYFNYNFEILRESCAISMFLIAWPYFLNKKWKKYYICAIIAILFHPSGVIILFIPLLRIKIFQSLFSFGINTVILIIGVYIGTLIISTVFFDLLRLIEISQVDSYVDIYENSSYAQGRSFNIIGIIVRITMILLYPIGAILLIKSNWMIKNKLLTDANYLKALEIMVCCYICFSVASINIKILYRFTNYFYPFLFIALANANLQKFKIGFEKFKLSFGIWFIILLPYISLNIYGNFENVGDSNISKIHRYYPYESVLFPQKDEIRERLFRNEGI